MIDRVISTRPKPCRHCKGFTWFRGKHRLTDGAGSSEERTEESRRNGRLSRPGQGTDYGETVSHRSCPGETTAERSLRPIMPNGHMGHERADRCSAAAASIPRSSRKPIFRVRTVARIYIGTAELSVPVSCRRSGPLRASDPSRRGRSLRTPSIYADNRSIPIGLERADERSPGLARALTTMSARSRSVPALQTVRNVVVFKSISVGVQPGVSNVIGTRRSNVQRSPSSRSSGIPGTRMQGTAGSKAVYTTGGIR